MQQEYLTNSSYRKNERGSILAYTVLSALALFLAVGFGADLAHLYSVKTELQNAADAAALAGASALDLPADKIRESGDRAVTVLNQNKYNFNNKSFVDGSPDIETLRTSLRQYLRYAVNLSEFDNGGNGMSYEEAEANPTDVRFIRVVTPTSPVNIFFALPILGPQRDLTASAVAGFSVPGNTTFCIIPLTAVQCDPNTPECRLGCDKVNDPTCSNNTFWGVCPGADPYALQTVGEGEPDPDNNGTCDPTREFCKRCKYTIRAAPSDGPSAGNYNALACAGRGGCELRMALAAAGDCQCTASPGQPLEVDTEPGGNAGPVRQGLNVRFDDFQCNPAQDPTCIGFDDCATNPDDHPPDLNIHQGVRLGEKNDKYWSGINYDCYSADPPCSFEDPSHPGQANRRVLILPVTPIGEFNDAKDGREKVKPSFFGGFFMTRAVGKGNDGNIQVEYMADEIVDVIGFDPNGDPPVPIVTPVLYR